MSGVFAGAMMTIMALVLFSTVIPLGGVNPLLLAPGFAMTVLLAGASAGRGFVSKQGAWKNSPLNWAVLCFFIYTSVRYLASPYEYEARNELFQVGLCALVYVVSAHQFNARRDRTLFVSILMVLAVFQAGLAMWQAFTHSDAVFHWQRPGYTGRGSGTYICPNHLAGFLEMVLGLVVARAAMVRRESQSIERSVILKVLCIYVAAMAILGILTTLSRAGWAATLVGLLALPFLGGWRLRPGLVRLGLVLAVITFMGLALWNIGPIRNYLIKSFPVDSKTQTISVSDSTLGGRTLMWRGTAEMIRDHPVFGTGIGSWQWDYQRYKDHRIPTEPDYPHNDFLNLASDYGMVGFAIMLAVFFCFFRHAWAIASSERSSEQRAFAVGAMISVISLLVHSWFDFNLHIPANSMLLAAIMGFTAAIGNERRQPANEPAHWLPRYLVGAITLAACGIGIRFFVPTVLAFQSTELGDTAKWETNYDAAFAHYKRASDLDPKYPKPHIMSGDIYLSSARWRMGPAKKSERRSLAHQAIESYERALSVNPTLAYVLVSKAQAHELAEQPDLALLAYRKALEVAPFNAYANYSLGCFYRDRGEDQKALELLEKANLYISYGDEGFQINEWEVRQRRGTAQPR